MQRFTIKSNARNQLVNIDAQVKKALDDLHATNGIAMVFCPHTTAAITINENADPDVCHDILADLDRLVPANQHFYRHGEGNSDSHLKASLLGASEQIIVEEGEMVLGTWQSIYFAEFDGPRTRNVFVSFIEL